MFYSLKGKLIYSDNNTAVVECGGVGYKCTVSFNTLKNLAPLGNEVTLFTHLAVREDAIDLFGFISQDELEFFKMLISVNGVGPKAAISVLSELSPEKLTLAIAGSDTKTITRANGVGPKMAQRIVLELKDKVSKNLSGASVDESTAIFSAQDVSSSALSEAIAALVALGYSQSEAASAVAGADLSQPVDVIIKNALKKLF